MLAALAEIVRDKWEWREQIMRLARFELLKRSKSSILSWAWLFIKPLFTVFCYWFALYIGFRHGRDMGDGMPPYILWLIAGVIPWFFMSEILGRGTDLMNSYSYLVEKVRFPLAAIPSIYVVTSFAIQLVLQLVLLGVYLACGLPLGAHLLQIPLLLALLFAFWDLASLLFSMLSAIDHGIADFIRALSTPLFWFSGVLFDVNGIGIGWLRRLLAANPITFFVTSFRSVLYYRAWVWDQPRQLVVFLGVFALLVAATALAYRHLAKEVPDVI